MITAKQARELAEQKYVNIYNAIETAAKNGKFSYELYYRLPNKIDKELQKNLEDHGFEVWSNVDYDYDTDHYGNILSSREVYTYIIKW